MNEVTKGIVKGLNSVTTPQSLTTQVIGGVINSTYTKETIRAMLLDPITSKLIPKLKYTGYKEVRLAFLTLYTLIPEKVLEKICSQPLKMKDEFDKLADDGEEQLLFYRAIAQSPISDGKGYTFVIKKGHTAIYVQLLLDFNEFVFMWNLFFVGPGAKELHKEFSTTYDKMKYFCTEGKKEKFSRRVDVYSFESGRRRPRHGYATVPSTVIVDHVEKDLIAVMDMVKKSEDVANTFDINKTTGVLLYGPHGTGKSTIARWFAMNLGRSILLTNADTLLDVIEYVKDHPSEKFIILIEDIDFKFVDRRESKKDDKNQDMMKNTDLLFQVLDGVLGENNLMVIATTNYIDRLDPALIRDSRFDFRIEVLGLTYNEAVKVCERFKVTPEEIGLSDMSEPISPASLQTDILKYKVTKHD